MAYIGTKSSVINEVGGFEMLFSTAIH